MCYISQEISGSGKIFKTKLLHSSTLKRRSDELKLNLVHFPSQNFLTCILLPNAMSFGKKHGRWRCCLFFRQFIPRRSVSVRPPSSIRNNASLRTQKMRRTQKHRGNEVNFLTFFEADIAHLAIFHASWRYFEEWEGPICGCLFFVSFFLW